MNKILRKRILRDLKASFLRYLALFLMIVMGMFIIISVVDAAETIIIGTERKGEENNVEDGQFAVFRKLGDEEKKTLADKGAQLEEMFSFDVDTDGGSVLRIFKVREKIDLIDADEGTLPRGSGEIFLEKRYCEEHDISVGDTVDIGGNEFKVTGIGTAPDYDAPFMSFSDGSVDSGLFGPAFVGDEDYELLKPLGKTEDIRYAYLLGGGLTHDELKKTLKGFDLGSDFAKALNDEYLLEMLGGAVGENTDASGGAADIGLLTEFVKAEDNPRIAAAAGDMQMNKNVGLLAGMIVMALFTYVISVFVIHRIKSESGVIGTLYALGAKKKDLVRHYVALPTLIAFIGGLVGGALGFSKWAVGLQTGDTYNYFSVPKLDAVYPTYLIIYAVAMPPIVSALVNFFVINKSLSRSALSLIRNEQKTGFSSGLDLKNMSFINRFRIRRQLREIRTGLTVIFGMIISMMILMLGLNCYALCTNINKGAVRDTKYEYMYTLKYPEKTPPENAEACYAETLSKTAFGYTLDVSVIGVDGESEYFGVSPEKGENKITASASAAQKYGLKKGDEITLTDGTNDKDYTFTVSNISDYSAGLAVFMNAESMRELFGKDEGYYNVLLSDTALDIPEGRLYSTTTKSDVERSSAVFIELMMPMITMLIAVSVIIFCTVMYLMLNVMTDRASFGISLAKIFGYRTKEIRKLYLDGNAAVVAVGAAAAIPIAKLVMNALYPYFVSNVSGGMDLHFPPYLYAAVYIGIMLIYAAVNALLIRKIGRVTPAEVLKNRE